VKSIYIYMCVYMYICVYVILISTSLGFSREPGSICSAMYVYVSVLNM